MKPNKHNFQGSSSLLRKGCIALAVSSALFLAGCQSELYSKLPEREVNEMISVLAANGITATRTDDGKGGYGLTVDRSEFSQAIATLSDKGLPRENFGSLGKVFNSDKLVSTPFEERARFMHALNEELSNSISRINGVASARVHIMVPEASPFEKTKTPPRASVFIYQEPEVDLRQQVPTIKNLIVNSLDNLDYANVEIALFESATTGMAKTSITKMASSGLWNILLIGALGLFAWFGFRYAARNTRGTSTSSKPRVIPRAE